MSQIQYNFNKNDEYYTPEYAVIPIIKYLKPNSVVWCPFDKDESQYVKVLKNGGFVVHNTHIEYGQDFFNTPPPLHTDYIISNPPYSQKSQVFERLYELNIPFAMLINFQGIFDSRERFEMFKNNRVEMMYLSPRVNYIKPDSSSPSGVPFQSGYLMSGICDKQIIFEYAKKGN